MNFQRIDLGSGKSDFSRGRKIALAAQYEISQGALSGAVRAEQHMDLALLHDKVEFIQDLLFVDPKTEIFYLQQWHSLSAARSNGLASITSSEIGRQVNSIVRASRNQRCSLGASFKVTGSARINACHHCDRARAHTDNGAGEIRERHDFCCAFGREAGFDLAMVKDGWSE
jgi:hypothetical protein